ncbi:cytochrome P450 CYP199 [Streptomyces griseoflavus Tu4000]|uniref:Cytochrome P450 CYP199 n=1 Tax=Streptomyces griseoflavus Tu4000 TaxID=467200 RepID=D9XLM3_9ACTN|nr:cytochrome P450 CYP199 [Streptomyces griseoflavus Tu4000]
MMGYAKHSLAGCRTGHFTEGMTKPPTSDVDLFADDVLLDPFQAYAELREQGPVVHLRKNDVYALTRYDVIRGALADWESFSSASIAFNPTANEALTGTSLASDPPAHTQLRAALTENLSPRALRGLKGRIETKADTLVAELVERGSFEAVDALARAFPLEVVADLIGFTGHVRDNMLRWGQAAMQVLGPMNQRTAENFPVAGELNTRSAAVRADDLAEGSVGRGIFEAEARGAIPPGHGRAHHPLVPRGRRRQHHRRDRQHRPPLPSHPDSCPGPRGPLACAGAFTRCCASGRPSTPGGGSPPGTSTSTGPSSRRAPRSRCCSGPATATPGTTTTRTPSSSPATRSTTWRSATGRTAAPARDSPVWRRTP